MRVVAVPPCELLGGWVYEVASGSHGRQARLRSHTAPQWTHTTIYNAIRSVSGHHGPTAPQCTNDCACDRSVAASRCWHVKTFLRRLDVSTTSREQTVYEDVPS